MSCVIRTTPPSLLPLFRSRIQGVLLARLFLEAEDGESLAELARQLDADPATIHREVDRLEAAGILTSRRVGAARVVRADPGSPIYSELRALLGKAFGPAPLLEKALSHVAGVDEAFIFGSWARRFAGEPGALPRDVDVLVIGSALPDDVYRAARSVEDQLGLEVNPIVMSEEEWQAAGGLVARVRREPLVALEVNGANDRGTP
jgi:predicted nucleotidyltransferase